MDNGKLNPLKLKFDKRGTLHCPSTTGIQRIEYDFVAIVSKIRS
jgi:hypothetical protein